MMGKSYECSILGLYRGIFKDISVGLPTVRGLERDESRLLSAIESRGIRYLTIDMPAQGKHFDKCLAEGRLVPSGIANFGMHTRKGSIPPFLGGLVSRVFDKDCMLLSQPCVTSIFFLRQLFNGAKKVKVNCTEKVREQALKTYLQQESSVRPPSLDWFSERPDDRLGMRLYFDDVCPGERRKNGDLFEIDRIPASYCDTVHDIADRIFSSFGEFHPSDWRPKHGPGAVSDLLAGEYKYNFSSWSSRLEYVFPSSEFAFANYSAWVDSLGTPRELHESEVPSVAITVPKSQVTPRIIAKEPTGNMWCQQIVRDYLESNVATSILGECISFRDQSFNQEAALQASLIQNRWTVDLSNASDSMSLWLIERMVRSNKTLLEALWSSRSVYCEVPTAGGHEFLRMKKFAPQGSATTFPLQTIVYAIIAIAACIIANGESISNDSIARAVRKVRVFGDDTIVPDYAGDVYVSLLTYLGFSVNHTKTFKTGKFRESCGTEAWDGTDVTPAYITYPYTESDPSSVASTVECSNNFFKKGLWHAAAALETTLPHWVRKYLMVRGPGDGSFGLTSFVGSGVPVLVRYNSSLHRYEGRALCVISTVTRRQPGGFGHLLQYFTEKPTPDIHWVSGVDGRPSSRVAKKWEPYGVSKIG